MRRTLTFLGLLAVSLLFISCNIGGDGISASEITGCYRGTFPDPHCPPDANAPLEDFYVQLWDDGSGEGGFWDNPITESDFFTWEILNDTLLFTSDFDIFNNTSYSVQRNDSTSFVLLAAQDSSVIGTFYLTQDTVSRVDYTEEQIVGTWFNARGNSYVFGADHSLQITGFSPTTWSRGDIAYTIENGWGSQWAVREYNGSVVIMAGYNNILSKQP